MTSGDSPSASASSSDGWKERIIVPSLLAGVVGGGAGLVSKHRKVHGLANISATYATNLSIITACFCGAREFVRVSRKTGPDDLLNSAIAGFGSGALLGCESGLPFKYSTRRHLLENKLGSKNSMHNEHLVN